MVEIDPLRPLNNLLWGWVQDEQHRLTIPRRAYEYDHEYGLKLLGKAVPAIRGADSRSRFLEGFHTLLLLCSIFYKEDDDTTVMADGFPVLNALREVHLLLTQGAHNQYGDLPWTARQEFLMQQWILARPEMREFLPRRIMVDYPEPWMDSRGDDEDAAGLDGYLDPALPGSGDLRREDPAVDPVRRVDRRDPPGERRELGQVLAARDAGIHPRLPRRDRRGSGGGDRQRPGQRHDCRQCS